MEGIRKKVHDLYDLMDELDFAEPTLNDEQWRENANKQLDALTLGVTAALRYHELTAVVLEGIVRAAEGKGLRAEEIRKHLGLDVREVPRVLKEGLRTKKIKAKGQKRATTYRAA